MSPRPAYTNVGGYPLLYMHDGWKVRCAACAQSTDTPHVHWEGEPLECEECGAEIESAYGTKE